MRYLLLAVVLLGFSVTGFSQKIYAPNTTNSLTGAATYCQNATPGVLTYTYNTCNSGSGTATGTALTIQWFSNTVNSTSGGTLQSTTFVSSATSATGNTTFLPSTIDVGTTYYYCVITWSGTGLCNSSGSLISPVAAVVTNTAPDVIGGSLSACVGTLTSLTNSVPGGTWTSATTARATIDAATGTVSAVSAGTSVISYTIGSCRSTATFTVNANPAAIAGTQSICQNATTTFSDATAGGTWTTQDPTVASINASSPVTITGGNSGTTNIVYTLSTGCFATRAITINTAPAAITGTASACAGTQTTLTNTVGGGTWTSATTTIATIAASGVVSAVAAGSSVISYTIGSCRTTKTFTVNANPAAIAGTQSICQNATTTFSDATAGGTWTTQDPTVASINASSPVTITGGNSGTTNIVYTLSTGCFATRAITINTAPAAITGTASACAGTQTTLTNTVGGGTWTSATTTIATIAASGVVSAVAAGSSVISYTIGSCRTTKTFTVNANPAAIAGTQTVCEGALTTFTDATAGGTWSSLDNSTATVTSSSPGVITGVHAGNTTISYTLATGCFAVRAVTVNTSPSAISGTLSACVGTLTTLTNTVPGGTWTSATTTRATIGAATGVVGAVSAGTSVISYTIGSCRSTATYTVNTTPAAITGTNVICNNAATTFTNTVAGGAWSIDNPSIASIGASTPLTITGANVGSATISYAIGTCAVTRGLTVNTMPDIISGTLSACVGTLTTLTNTVPGGTWTSATTATATIGAATGVVGAVAAGTSVISYTIGSCRSTATFTVNTTPAAITGTNVICNNAATTFTNTVAGGAWSIDNPSIASIGASTPLTITGANVGSATISYAIGTCAVTRGLTVNTMPDIISGTLSACVGTLTTLTNTVPGGTWTSATTATATIGAATGVVGAVAAGTSVISYTIGSCRSTATFTVNANPAAITGTFTVCEQGVTSLADATVGGAWSSANETIATVNSGAVTGGNSGTAVISYTLPTGCFAVKTVTVNNTPDPISGSSTVCRLSTTTLSDATASGVWSSSNTAIATINSSTGVVTGSAVGSVTISYTTGSCRVTAPFTVLTVPAAITGGTTSICESAQTTFVQSVTGGAWSSADPSIASVNASGLTTGIAHGTTIISYSTGCGAPATKSVTVDRTPVLFTGNPVVCENAVTSISNSDAGGSWSGGSPSVATIDGFGYVYGLSSGNTTITYTIGSCSAIQSITVNAMPAPISGRSLVCTASPVTFTDFSVGGSWSTTTPAVTTVDASGVVTGLTSGAAVISYTINYPSGSCAVGYPTTVEQTPSDFSGTPAVCEGAVTTLTNSIAAGSWSSATPAVATVDASGVVYGVTSGTTDITYTAWGCPASLTVTVNAMPAAISGGSFICTASPVTFTDASVGGIWSSNNVAVATVAASGVVTGLSTGTANISYTLNYALGSCAVGYTTSVNVTPSNFTGTPVVCENATTSLGNSDSGGTWSVGSVAVATVDPSGNIYGVHAGNTNITYTLGGCSASQPITVNAMPAPISGRDYVCTEYPVTFTDATVGGIWSTSDSTILAVDSLGVVSVRGIFSSATISYTMNYGTGSCAVGYLTRTDLTPSLSSGTPAVCVGAVTTLSFMPGSGTWESMNPDVATVDASGVVHPVTPGIASIYYTTMGSGCFVQQPVTVNVKPAAVIAAAPVTCYNYSSDVIFTGTAGSTITYKVDGGADQTAVLSGGSVSLNTGVITSSHTYQLVEVHTDDCATTLDTTATVTTQPMQWVGGVSGHETDWTKGGNWSCGFVPGDTTDVTIPAGTLYSPSIPDFAFAGAKNLTIASGAQISIAGTQLSVKGTLSNNGSITGTGPVVMAGSSAQTITGFGRVNNINFNNAAGVTIPTGSRLTVIKNLSMSAGTLTTSDSLVMYSDAAYTAAISSISFGAAISGNVKIMQYVPGGYRRYRFWSHPFSSSISFSQIQQYIDITGQSGATNGFTTTTTNNPSCFRYNPLVGNSSLGSDPGWRAITKINASAADSNLFHQFQGLRLFIRGTKGQGLGLIAETPNPVTIYMVGAVNQGDQFITLSRGATTLQDYNMIGNPYPSPVDLGTVMYNAKQAGVVNGSAFYVWDPYLGAGGQYISVPIGSGGPTPYYIQANTAFQVRVAHNGDILTFTEGNKFGRYDTLLLRQAPEFVSLEIFDANEHKWDELRVKFDDKATDVDDNTADAHKLCGPDFNLYSLSADGQRLSIDARPYSDDMIIPVGIASDFKQDFTIRAADVVTPGGRPVYLHDRLKDKYTLLEPGAAYSFTIGADKSTQGDARFELTAKPGTTKTTGFSIALAPNPATDAVTIMYTSAKEEQLSVRLLDINGVTVYSSDLGTVSSATTSIPVKSLAAGVYMVEVTHGAEKMVKRLVKE